MLKEKTILAKNVFLVGSHESIAVEARVGLVGYSTKDLPRAFLDDVDSHLRIGDGSKYISLLGYTYGKPSNTIKNVKALRELADLIHTYADSIEDALEVVEAEKKAHNIALKELAAKNAKKAKKNDKKD